MNALFFQVLDMSISASILAGVVVLLRLVLHKAPKAIHCALWAMVALRLICPALPESQVSLMPASQPVTSVVLQESQKDLVTDAQPQLPQASVPNNVVTTPTEPEKTVDWAGILTGIWLAGVGVMALYGLGSYLYLRRKVAPSVREDGIWICDHVASPFILGLFRPRIYLPSSLEPAYRPSVLSHERAHLRRGDHWWKPLGFVLLTVHWFNPVMWLAYVLLCRDIEAACDERVVKGMEAADRRLYSEALLSCAVPRRSIAACPLAFGEQGIKGRIKSVLSYKKPTVWIILVAIVASIAVGVFFLTNPIDDDQDEDLRSVEELVEIVPEYFGMDGAEIYVWEEDGELLCGALPITSRSKEEEEIRALTGIKLEEMARILDTYAVPDWHIVVNLFGQSQHWTQEQSHDYFAIMDLFYPRLGLYIPGKNETTGTFTVATEEDVEQVFGKGYFYAKGYDGLYKVYCSDTEGISEGNRLSISYADKKDVEGKVKHEITAKKIYNHSQPSPSVDLVIKLRIVESVPSGVAFESDCFYATDEDKNLYRVKWSDMSALKEGQVVCVTYDYALRIKVVGELPPGEWTVDYEITASQVEVQPDDGVYVSTVYFSLFDNYVYENGFIPEQEEVSYYAAPVTQEELDILQGLHGDRRWYNLMFFSSLGWYDGAMNVVVDGKWSIWTLYRNGILTEKGFSSFTEEERAVYNALMDRAALSEDAKNYFTGDYVVYRIKSGG